MDFKIPPLKLNRYHFAFCVALAVHLVIAVFLFSHTKQPQYRQAHAKKNKHIKIVRAVAIDTRDVRKTVAQIKRARDRQRLEHQRILQEAAQATKRRQEENSKLKQLEKQMQAEQLAEKIKRTKATEKLSELERSIQKANASKKLEQELASKKLAKLKRQMDRLTHAKKNQVKLASKKIAELKRKMNRLNADTQRRSKELHAINDLTTNAKVAQKKLEQVKKERELEIAKLEKIKQEAQEKLQAAKKESEKIARQRAVEAKRLKEIAIKRQQEIEKLKQAKAKEKRLANLKTLLEIQRRSQIIAKQKEREKLAAQNAQLSGQIDKYKTLIIQAISLKWIPPVAVDENKAARLRVRLAPGGIVLSVTVIKSSGNHALDHSAKIAVYKASPLPVPTNSEAFNTFRELNLTVRKEGVLSAG